MTNTELWQEYEDGLLFQRRMGFAEDFPKYVRFKEGNQWAAPTQRTRNLPRPVFNIIEMFIRNKRAAVLNQPIGMTFSPAESADGEKGSRAEQNARDMTEYAKLLWNRLGQDALSGEMIDDAATLGTGILHYYYDDSVRTPGSRPCIGEIRGESIDPLSIFFADPQLCDLQKQEYVLIASRRRVGEVRALAQRLGCGKETLAAIVPDEAEAADYGTEPDDSRELCTVLTKYYRKGGEVCFDRATRSANLAHGQRLTPPGGRPVTMYPLALMVWKRRKKCIFGIGEAEGLIPNQKAINFNLAMMLLSVQQTAWPKLLSTPGAIRQPVTNEPGEHLIDYSAGGGGIRYLAPPEFSATAVGLSNTILELSRSIAGVSDVTTGEIARGSLAASAIIALQNQAKTPIVEIQHRYWEVVRQIGTIWAQLIGAYYTLNRPMTVTEEGKRTTRLFCGKCCRETEFDLRVDVGASSEFGEALSQATLDSFLQNGYITVDQYIELAPDNVVPFRERLRQMRAGQTNAENGKSAVPEENGGTKENYVSAEGKGHNDELQNLRQ